MKTSNLSFMDGFNPNGQGQINKRLSKTQMTFYLDKTS